MTATGALGEALRRVRSGQLDLRAFGGLLHHCAERRLLRVGLQLHARLVLHSVTPSNYLASELLSFYSKNSLLRQALDVFHRIPRKNLFSYNALLIACSRHDPSLCPRLFSRLAFSPDPLLRPDAFSISALLKSLSGSVASLREIHAYVVRSCLSGDLFVCNGLVLLYSRFGELGHARKVFDAMPLKDLVSWNSIVSGCSQSGHFRECLEFYRRMMASNMPNNVTVASVLLACSELRDLEFGAEIHNSFAKYGIVMDSVVWNSVIGFYAKCGKLDYARQLFDEMPEKDEVTYGAIISGYMRYGFVEQAVGILHEMANPALSSWNAVISGFVQNNCHSEVLSYFHAMQRAGYRPNSVTLSSVLPTISFFSNLLGGKQLHAYAMRNCLDQNVYVVAALIDMYSKAGSLDMAREVFLGTYVRSAIVWTSLISACATHGDANAAVALFSDMVAGGIRPDHVTFTAVLAACSHAGLVDEARNILGSMSDECGISPTSENYACMVAVLSRAGLLEEAVDLLCKVPAEPNAKAWGALLNGASVWGDVKVGRVAFDHLVRIESESTGNYVIMANMYSRVGDWREASKIRSMMKTAGLSKLPGCSWIEMANGLEVFVARDTSKAFSGEMYAMLGWLIGTMREEGYVCSDQFDEEIIK